MSFDIAVRRRLGEADLAFAIRSDATLIGIVGRSGAGKSSLLNMVAGLLRPDSGHIRVAGLALFDAERAIDLPPEGRNCGYVFQDARLFPHMRVAENLRYGIARRSAGAPPLEFDHVVDFLGVASLLDRWPANLSGGEARRIAIGRALLSSPDFLLLDEPLTGLDRARRDEILRVIENLRDAFALPTLYVSHERPEVERLARNIITVD